VDTLVHCGRLGHRGAAGKGRVWETLLRCTLDDDDNNNALDLSASLCFNCASYNVDALDPCMINSAHFLSVISTPTTKTAIT
jgi:hypothetical protein